MDQAPAPAAGWKSEEPHVDAELVFRELGPADDPRVTDDLLLPPPALSDELFEELVTEGHVQGLRYLIASTPSGRPPVGYRTLVASRGRVLFVDDLVTDEATRSRGAGRTGAVGKPVSTADTTGSAGVRAAPGITFVQRRE
ncbi:hypothetical protein AB0878_19700 [Amycolatopsis sp. NPDC047767]|uniref:hypothetical protein n=1 Tax=Amycolatopsis sp. NPDC047767 TaxID=3156765 RepID=UPI0034550E6F